MHAYYSQCQKYHFTLYVCTQLLLGRELELILVGVRLLNRPSTSMNSRSFVSLFLESEQQHTFWSWSNGVILGVGATACRQVDALNLLNHSFQ
jgi:hypothetical protein